MNCHCQSMQLEHTFHAYTKASAGLAALCCAGCASWVVPCPATALTHGSLAPWLWVLLCISDFTRSWLTVACGCGCRHSKLTHFNQRLLHWPFG